MAILTVTHSDGDVRYAGTTSDIDKLNGENYRINNHTHDGTDTAYSSTGSLILLHSGTGTTTATSETELDTHTFSTDDFTAEDECYVEIIFRDNSGVGDGVVKINCEDSDSNVSTSDLCTATGAGCAFSHINQDEATNTSLHAQTIKGATGDALTISINALALGDTAVITTAWTINLRGSVGTSGSLYWKWKVYKKDTI